MAASTARTESAIVGVIILMTGKTVGGGALEDIVDVAVFTGHSNVFSG